MAKTKARVAAKYLKMPENTTPSRFRNTTAAEDVLSENGEALWRPKFYEALDILMPEIEHRFDQNGMITAEWREEILLDAVKGTMVTETDLNSLLLPINIDIAALYFICK